MTDTETKLDVNRGQDVVRLRLSKLRDSAKRLFDVVAALLGLIILFPLFVFVGIMIKRDTEGPVFYRGVRMGRNGRPFRILKFRTMHESAASYSGPPLTSSNDPRITPLGYWLRNTKINELPQLWNVVTGDMSLVGPRPEDPEIIKTFPDSVRAEILSVRPGLTSPASILYHSEQDLLANTDLMTTYLHKIVPDKVRLDQLYVRNRSFVSDLDVIFWTLAIFVPHLAKTTIPEGYLYAGPVSRFFYRHFSWFLADMVVAFIATSIATIAWRTQQPLNWGWDNLLGLSVGFALVFSAVNYLFGLNRIVWSRATWNDAFGIHLSAGCVTSGFLFLNYLQEVYGYLPFSALPSMLILSVGLVAHLGFLSVRYRLRLLGWLSESLPVLKNSGGGTGERTFILGDGETSSIASWLLRHGLFRHVFSIVGIVANEDPTKQGMQINGCRVVGGIRDLPGLVKQYDVRIIVYTIAHEADHIRDMIFAMGINSDVKVVFLDDLVKYVSPRLDKQAEAHEYLAWLQHRTDISPLQDALTGLPNDILLEDRIRHSLAYSKRYETTSALVLIDLKASFDRGQIDGQSVEDRVIEAAAKRLAMFKRESDTLARFRRYEFALFLENIPNYGIAERIRKRAKSLLATPFLIGGDTFSVQPEMGLIFPVVNLEDLRKRLQRGSSDAEDVVNSLASKTMKPMAVAGRRSRDLPQDSESGI